MTLLRLYWEFFKTGLFSVGGGLATLPFLYEMGEKTGWFTTAQVADMLAVSESTPGGIGVNMATYAGFTAAGVPGGIVATLGLVFPSLVIISLLAGAIEAFSHIEWVQHAFGGIQVCVCVLIINAVVKLYKKAVVDKLTFVLFLLVALGSYFLPISPVVFVVLAALTGIAVKSVEGRKKA